MNNQSSEKLLNKLRNRLEAKDWKTANEITFCLFFETIPEDISNPGWIHYQDLHKIKDEVLKESDRLWVYHSEGRFGFSVQWQIFYQLYLELYLEGKHRDYMMLEETFAEKVGRIRAAGYDIKEVNFSLDFPQGYLPWFHWYDSQNYKFRSGITGGGGVGWEAIFYVAELLERSGAIPPEGKVWNRQEIIEKIKEGNPNFSRGNLVGIDLQGLDLSNANFLGADLSQSNLAKAKLNKTNFYSANLYEANLSQIEGINTYFRKAKLEGTIFWQAQLVNVDLTKVSAFRAIFDESKWENVNATEGDFFAANFYWVICQNTSFSQADISYTSWQEAILKDCNFAEVVKNKARLKMTKFVGKNWNSQLDKLTTSKTKTLANLPLAKYKPIDKRSPTIFIIDDSITVRELLSMTFTKAGYKVVLARDGQDAWEQLKVGLVCDFILSNIEMPRMDGIEFLSRVKKDEKLKDIPFALLTSRGANRMRTNNWWDERIVARFTKPYIEQNLLETVANTLKILPENKQQTLAKEITNKRPTILIVDDSIVARELLTMTFTKAGYDVIKAKDGKDALDRLNTGVVCDFIFSNIEMPKMDGFQFLAEVKQDEKLKNIPFAFISSTNRNKNRISSSSWNQSIVAHFTKPFIEEQLLETVTKALNNLPENKEATLAKEIIDKRSTIFIVNYSNTVRKLLRIALTKAGYKIVEARDGRDAWEQLKAGLICHFIFCDTEMPRMDGFEFLSRIKQDEKLNNIPLAFLSSQAKRRKDISLELGAVPHFTKPFIEEQLLETVTKTLNNFPENQEQTLAKEITDKRPTILIVHYSNTVRKLLRIALTKAGYKIVEARDGGDAWEQLKAGLICHFIFCDTEMPRMDGFEFLSRIKQYEKLNNIPLAFLSSQGKRRKDISLKLGAIAHFTIPFIEEQLLETVANTLSNLPENQDETLAENWKNKPPTILIIDSSITVRKLFVGYKTARKLFVGYKIVEARDGGDAWEQLQAGLNCDFIFCDTEMPRMDGFEFLSRIKQDEKLKNIPLAFLSSQVNRKKDISLELGAVAHFTKPFIEKDLLETVTKTLNNLPENQDETLAEKWKNKTPTILIIGTSFDKRQELSHSFIKAGYQVFRDILGTDSWQILQSNLNNIDFILSDLGNLELLEKVKQDEALHNIPLAIIHTKEILPFIREQFDIVDYFTYPYVEQKLLKSIAKIIGREAEYLSFLENSIEREKENINSGKLRQSQTRFFVVGLNLEQRKQLVTLFRFKPNLFCHFFPENQLLNSGADKFNTQLLISQLQERIINNISPPSYFNNFYNLSNTYNCTFIPDNLLNYFAEISDNSSSCSLYLLIQINVLKSLSKLNLKEALPQFSTIVIDDKNKLDIISSDFLKQLQQNWNTKAYITNLKAPDILETFASVVNGEAPIEKKN
ncbi:response regulator [Okeania sp.]|uniref:response regulator n=1 Tax=Okeania sp. TaxID=3100323 RepID=UPI002B4B8AF0|nr:response regulator [Okeania sp.]MEB3340161.1 response regulator [Okeania sp.]